MSRVASVFILIISWISSSTSFYKGAAPAGLLKRKSIVQRHQTCSERLKFAIEPRRSLSLRASVSSDAAAVSSIPWKSIVSTRDDLYEAIDEILSNVEVKPEAYDIALFFVSSIYEASAFKYTAIYEAVRKRLPSIKFVIGSTTGGVIGSVVTPWGEPTEVEARASLGITFIKLDSDVDASVFSLPLEDVQKYIKSDTQKILLPEVTRTKAAAGGGAVTLLFAAGDGVKSSLTPFVNALGDREGIEALGAVASSVTSLQVPKVFIGKAGQDEQGLERLMGGVIGLILVGNIRVQTVLARSVTPVGPVFSVAEANGRDIMMLKRETEDGLESFEPQPPLVELDTVLKDLPNELSFPLKKELLVACIPATAQELRNSGALTIGKANDFFGQKPIAFDPFTGSITIPSLPGIGSSLQFCIRDNTAARQDLLLANEKLRAIIETSKEEEASPLSLLLLGSVERGNKVFRYQSWEAAQLYQQLKKAQLESFVPVLGLQSYGAFARIRSNEKSLCALTEADAIYAYLTKLPKKSANVPDPSTTTSSSTSSVVAVGGVSVTEDVLSAADAEQYSDENDGVIVTKRDPESAHPVRVASMDYFIPEKVPQPKNVLESLVWDREKDVDRMRERFQLARALAQAKMSEAKFPKRSLIQAVKEANAKAALLSTLGGGVPPLLIECVRASLHNGRLAESSDPQGQMLSLAGEALLSGAVAIGGNADYGTFRGQFEDLEVLKRNTQLPVFCNDFVVYGYQLFRAKSSGADAVKLMASVLTVQDIAYNIKVGKALGIMSIVVVSSKSQLIDVLAGVPDVQAISVTSRNMRLWKISPGKASRILNDPEVKAAIAAKRSASAAAGEDFLLLQEAFTNSEELVTAKKDGVDAVFLGEELLLESKEAGLKAAVDKWML